MLQEPVTKMRRYHPPDALMQFLQALKLCRDRRRLNAQWNWASARSRAATLHSFILCIGVANESSRFPKAAVEVDPSTLLLIENGEL